ncbi:DAN domain family member 5 [Erpetoichthys calabaricus]|uniref:DAN domain family member 5 n=1 Tax=Erpetoichthys calabaricus TaxID=27687 RepID=UPI00223492C6|nr:DAN domain family member 5 [Erpetoichthys calabaricus]
MALLFVQLLFMAVLSGAHSPGGHTAAHEEDMVSSGTGSNYDEPLQGTVRVVQASSALLKMSPLFTRRLDDRPRALGRGPLPPFLALGRPGPALSQLNKPLAPAIEEPGEKQRKGLEMWKAAIKKDLFTAPVDLKEQETTEGGCTAISFSQRLSAPGCDAVTLRNKLCFGRCSSLYVPEAQEASATTCSRCAPIKTRVVSIPLRCLDGRRVLERRVTLVYECKCEMSSEAERWQAFGSSLHLKRESPSAGALKLRSVAGGSV